MKLNVVLVRTEYSANIGSTARAMANMGAERLILIDPQCSWTDDKAKEMAAGAQSARQAATVYGTWKEFFSVEGDGLRIAFTRRAGRNRKVYPFAEKLASFETQPENLYLIFGPEASGLDGDDLAFVNFTVHLPVFGDFASLNLAQAVLLALFMTRQRFPPAKLPAQVKGEVQHAVRPFYFPDRLIREWLTVMGFDIQARRSSAYLTLKRLLLHNLPTVHEIQVLEAILQQNIRKLRSLAFTAKNGAHDLSDVSRKDI